MEATLALSSDRLAEDDLQSLTRELSMVLNRETDVAAAMPEAPPEPGARGDPITLGTLVLTFMTSGAAVAMFEVLKTYFERNASLQMKLKRDDGQELVIDQTNMRSGQIDKTLAFAREFFDRAS
jgi:hypothetical protein